MKKYLKYFIFLIVAFISFKLPVFAAIYTNVDKYYDITIPDYGFENQLVDDSHTFRDFIQYLSSFQSEYYDLFVFASPSNGSTYTLGDSTKDLFLTDITIVSKQSPYTYGTLFAYRYSSSTARFRYFTTNENVLSHSYSNGRTILMFSSNYTHKNVYEIDNLFTDESTLAFINCYTNNNCSDFQSGNSRFSNRETSFSTNLSNTNSPTFNYSTITSLSSSFLYYSSADLVLTAPTTNLSYDIYVKTPRINGDIYDFGGVVPTYCILHNVCPIEEHNSFTDYESHLDTFYTNFTPSQADNFVLNIDFYTDINTTAISYRQAINYDFGCYGRKNVNNNYFTYEKITCDIAENGDFELDSNKVNLKFEELAFYDSNDNLISDLSSYDKLFMYITFSYNTFDIIRPISNMSFTFNGNVYYSPYIGPIYDSFRSLPHNFKMFLSTFKKDYTEFRVKYISDNSSLFSIRYQSYNTLNFDKEINPGYITNYFNFYKGFNVNNSLNLGFMIFQKENSLDEGNFLGLDLVIYPDIIISLNNESNDTFYYYDNTGTITSSSITINYDNISTDNYDFSYYFNEVSSFLDDMSEDALNFAALTQEFYDSLPLIIRGFSFVIFILFCTYFTFGLIKK